MPTTRRTFLHVAGAAGLLGVGGTWTASPALGSLARGLASEPKRVLFLGGTGMLGPHVVERLRERGHTVTLFNRGNREELFPDLELIRGNRIVSVEPGLDPLRAEIEAGRRWDVVIDTANVHSWVEDSAKLLAEAAEHYVFTSSMSVYADNATVGMDESAPTATMPDDVAAGITTPRYDMRWFGGVKVRCEEAAERWFPARALLLRPGLIVGPRDFSHRFTYWPWRVNRGGEVLAPGAPDHPVQFIDVRDLAAFMVDLIERGTSGPFNVNGPVEGVRTMGETLEACRVATGSDARFTWADTAWLGQQGIGAWVQMPLWIPPVDGMRGFHTRNIDRAIAAGLTVRPIVTTIRDTLSWFEGEFLPRYAETMRERGTPEATFRFGDGRPGITPAREAELLAAWHARPGGTSGAPAVGAGDAGG